MCQETRGKDTSHDIRIGHKLCTLPYPPAHTHTHTHSDQLTRANGSWLPRLERMVESRKLCNFEKNVLLLLIGSVIQPNKVGGAS